MAFKKCPKCLAEFDCCNDKSGCWCEEIALGKKTLSHLSTEFTDCLCPACLKSYEDSPVQSKS